MQRTIFLHELEEMALESWLRCMGACDLDSVAEGLQSLLLPEHWVQLGYELERARINTYMGRFLAPARS